MGFSPEDKIKVHSRGREKCQFPGEDCDRINTGKINHITGVFEAFLEKRDPKPIRDISMNAILLCSLHEFMHDLEEHEHVETLLYERRGGRHMAHKT